MRRARTSSQLAAELAEHGQAVGAGHAGCPRRPDALEELLPAILGLAIHEAPVEILNADEDGTGSTPLAENDRLSGSLQVVQYPAESIPYFQGIDRAHSWLLEKRLAAVLFNVKCRGAYTVYIIIVIEKNSMRRHAETFRELLYPPRMLRNLLEHVPRIHFHDGGSRCPEDICFPSVMRAVMEYMKEDDFGCRSCRPVKPRCRIPCAYSYFIGVTGVASFLSWKPGWEMDNVEITYMSDDPAAPFARAFEAAGYEYRIHGPGGNVRRHREAIRESIDEGRPVIAFGPIGPPEAALVTGYDEDGEVLTGWSFFQGMPEFNQGVAFEPTGEFRVRDWAAYPPGFCFITIGAKRERPPIKESLRGALEWMVHVARTPVTSGSRANGLAAYSAWAAQLERDEDFTRDEAGLRQRYDAHNNLVGFLAEARWYGSQFLVEMTVGGDDLVHRGAIEDLYAAAALYAGEHELMWQAWDQVGGIGNPDAWRRFADPGVQRKIAAVIIQARDKDAMATDRLERVLQRWR
jgi:hypothetical protein